MFLDRDGTLIRDAHYLKDPAKLEIIPGIADLLPEVRKAGYLLFMHTNQSGIARGYYDWADVHACNLHMHHEFGWPTDFFSEVCISPELPEEAGGYRKPSPRFEEEMIIKFDVDSQQCWVIGDKWIDPQTGLSAGMRGALVKTGKPIDKNTHEKARQADVPIYHSLAEFLIEEIQINE